MGTYTNTFGVSEKKRNKYYSENVQGYGEWLNSIDWGYFCTLTTHYPQSVASARRMMNKLHGLLSENKNNPLIFWVAEPFDSLYGYHVHALIKVDSKNGFKAIKKCWRIVSKSNRNYTVIQKYIRDKGANFYVAKYLSRNSTDYDILI